MNFQPFGNSSFVYKMSRHFATLFFAQNSQFGGNDFPNCLIISFIYNINDRVVSDIQARAEGKRQELYAGYNTDANVVNGYCLSEVILTIHLWWGDKNRGKFYANQKKFVSNIRTPSRSRGWTTCEAKINGQIGLNDKNKWIRAVQSPIEFARANNLR